MDVTVAALSTAGAGADQISDVPAWVLVRATSVHVSPAPDTVDVWLVPRVPSDATNATSRSFACWVLNAGVVAVDPVPLTVTVVSMTGAGVGVTAADAADGAPGPTAFAAATVNVYAVPFVNPDTDTDVAGGDPDTTVATCATPPTNGVTEYDEIGLPPLDGATHDTAAEPLPATATTPDGAPGTVGGLGVTAADAADAAPGPTAFAAATVNVYAVPFVNPDTDTDVAGGDPDTTVATCATPPTNGVTEYDEIGLPPLDGSAHVTVAEPLPAAAVTPVT